MKTFKSLLLFIAAPALLLSACSGGNSEHAVVACSEAGQANSFLMGNDLPSAYEKIHEARLEAFEAANVTNKHQPLLDALNQAEFFMGVKGLEASQKSIQIAEAMSAVLLECEAIGAEWQP